MRRYRFDTRRRYRRDSQQLSDRYIKGFYRMMDDMMEIVRDAIKEDEDSTLRATVDIIPGEVLGTLWVDGVNEYRESIPMGDLDMRKFAAYTKGRKRDFKTESRIEISRHEVEISYATDTIWALGDNEVHDVFIDAFDNCQA